MRYIADLHIHSYLSRACSKDLKPETLARWCQLKGITVLATGDFTHPAWIAELQEKLEPAEPGLFQLKKELQPAVDEKVPASCRASVRFILGVEISSIYKKNERVRKVHNLVFAPSFEAAMRLNASLEKIGNIRSDGRPILGLDSKHLFELVLQASPQACLVPAHAWTPHFGVFGSESGFDTLEECFEDLTPEIFSIETGLSSDPAMNARLTQLDRLTLMSNSDAHSPEKLAREANVLEGELSYKGLFDAFRKKGPMRVERTLEFFPEEGKYHVDGHRACGVRLTPKETQERNGLCPVCNKEVTVGVLARIEKLADRAPGIMPKGAPAFTNIIPLKEILGEIFDVGTASRRVDAEYHRLLNLFGTELSILTELPVNRLESEGFSLLAASISRMRQGQVHILPGYDGEYGTISLLSPADRTHKDQLSLL